MKKLLNFIFSRVVITVFFLLFQVLLLAGIISEFKNYFSYFYFAFTVISILFVLHIINNTSNPAFKIAWLILILTIPIFGVLFYAMFGMEKMNKKQQKKMAEVNDSLLKIMGNQKNTLDEIGKCSQTALTQSRYIAHTGYYPPFANTQTEYLSSGEVKFERLKEELNKAEHYIFLEYFIIEEGVMWNTILEILVRKVNQGVDVRVIYDDIGTITTLPHKYNEKLEALGIKCRIFNPFIPILSSHYNNRDHRKIAIIDGHTGFTGGANIADEYINAVKKHGHWKDTAMLLKGEAVWSLTLIFLSMWDYINGITEDYTLYNPHVYQKEHFQNDGFVQPFADSPLDEEAMGQNVYLNLIDKATRYVYINTPYLILDYEMITALTTAAKSGIDVRIVLPHIEDKWYVHIVTRSYYATLLEGGVHIYEYTPGFMHAKSFVVDDEYGVIGTINIDFRSFYLHFECGIWLYKTNSILDLKKDFLTTLEFCKKITIEECQAVKWYTRLGRSLLRVFAPLM